MFITLIVVLSAFVVSVSSALLARRLAVRYRIFARPNHRTIHVDSTPKLGGLSIFVAFLTGFVLMFLLGWRDHQMMGLLTGGTVALAVGLLDDIYHLSCYRKLIGQAFAASIAVSSGFHIKAIYWPGGATIELGVWAIPFSVFWIVSIINALNLLDGLDGLASGFAISISLFIAIGAAVSRNTGLLVTALVLIAATLGFLKHNLNPAKMFMGDMGSLFLGFMLASLSIKAFSHPSSHLTVLVVLFLIPLTDTTLCIFRRVCAGRHPFSADKKHLHHRLLEHGLNQTQAVMVIYGATFLCGAL
ncbi:undecaprenyl/decaprenyl-phosphate alpha-N-acetylglucosaminyl 1-phosphate transferase, partial [bacterium]|nr:undecaprenyl/decaprenyl-phosphate alpha-N-acetylglucosaminyl 1-phosphate transferase [bacterium]